MHKSDFCSTLNIFSGFSQPNDKTSIICFVRFDTANVSSFNKLKKLYNLTDHKQFFLNNL